MGYTPQQWSDQDPTKPASAARFAYMEGGIAGNSDRLDAVESGKVAKGDLVFNVKDYGAALDGTTDDDAAVQAAINAATATNTRALVTIPQGTAKFTSVTLNAPGVSITGPGAVAGKIVVGDTNYKALNASISNLRFIQSGRVAGSSGIEINAVDHLNITENTFEGMDVGIRVLPYVVPVARQALQNTTRVRISGNRIWNTNYAFQVRNDAASVWSNVGDIDFIGNICGGSVAVGGIDCSSIDGLKVANCTFFMPSYQSQNATKLTNITISGMSDWLVISDNNFFEAGLSGINLTAPRRLTITGNNIAWPGQRVGSDAIKITTVSGGFTRGVISDNNIDDYTGSAIGVYGTGDASSLVIGTNNTPTSTTPASYYGPALPASRVRYFADTTLTGAPTVTDAVLSSGPVTTDQIGGVQLESNRRVGARSGVTSRGKVVSVTAASTAVGTMAGYSGAGVFGGLLLVYAQNSDATKSCFYAIAVGGGTATDTRQVTVMATDGLSGGAAADDPSFTFAANNAAQLLATPVGATSGSFTFYVTTLGNVRFA